MGLVILLLLYILPSIVAVCRRTNVHAGSIFIINLFLGWTFLGWVVALAMAVKSPS